MIDCYQNGGIDKDWRIWICCEICAYSKLISEFSNMIIECDSFEICNDCDKKFKKKSAKKVITIIDFKGGKKKGITTLDLKGGNKK